MRTSTMAGDNTKPLLTATGLAPNMIQALDSDGFTVGSDATVNGTGAGTCSTCTYYWTAFKANANVKVGSYAGSGLVDGDNLAVFLGLGYSPDYLIILGAGNRWAMHRTASGGTLSMRFNGTGYPINDAIIGLDASGFSVQRASNPGNSQNTSATGRCRPSPVWPGAAEKAEGPRLRAAEARPRARAPRRTTAVAPAAGPACRPRARPMERRHRQPCASSPATNARPSSSSRHPASSRSPRRTARCGSRSPGSTSRRLPALRRCPLAAPGSTRSRAIRSASRRSPRATRSRSGLRPAAAPAPGIAIGPSGTVRPASLRRRPSPEFGREFPRQAARVAGTGFQGEIKKALVELAPLRWDGASGQLRLARRLRVRLVFTGTAGDETALGGARGRRPRHRETSATSVVSRAS
jgi:hypothetical protein